MEHQSTSGGRQLRTGRSEVSGLTSAPPTSSPTPNGRLDERCVRICDLSATVRTNLRARHRAVLHEPCSCMSARKKLGAARSCPGGRRPRDNQIHVFVCPVFLPSCPRRAPTRHQWSVKRPAVVEALVTHELAQVPAAADPCSTHARRRGTGAGRRSSQARVRARARESKRTAHRP